MTSSLQKPLRFSRTMLFTFVLIGMLVVAAVAHYMFNVNLRTGQLAAVVALGVVSLFLVGQLVRFRARVSLRTLLIVISVLAVGLAYVGRRIAMSRTQHIAVQKLVDLGAKATYSRETRLNEDYFETEDGWYLPTWLHDLLGAGFFTDLREISFAGSEVEDHHLALLQDIRHLEAISLRGPDITAAGIARMPVVHGVEYLDMDSRQVTPESLERLSEFRHLESVMVLWPFDAGSNASDPITDMTGLAELSNVQELSLINISPFDVQKGNMSAIAQMPSLRKLQVVYGAFSKPDSQTAGYAALGQSRTIRELEIVRLQFGDAELELLKPLGALNRLVIAGTNVTPGAMKEFSDARPNVTVNYSLPFGGVPIPAATTTDDGASQ